MVYFSVPLLHKGVCLFSLLSLRFCKCHSLFFFLQKNNRHYILVFMVGNLFALLQYWCHLFQFAYYTQGHDCKRQTLTLSAFRTCQNKLNFSTSKRTQNSQMDLCYTVVSMTYCTSSWVSLKRVFQGNL